MGLYEELLAELSRSAEPTDGGTVDVQALQREVAALRRTVARLAELISVREHDRPTRQVIRRQLLEEAQGPLAPPVEEPPTPVFEGSPYRGAVALRPGRSDDERCRRCHKPLEADDPDLEGEEGRICMACFQHGEP